MYPAAGAKAKSVLEFHGSRRRESGSVHCNKIESALEIVSAPFRRIPFIAVIPCFQCTRGKGGDYVSERILDDEENRRFLRNSKLDRCHGVERIRVRRNERVVVRHHRALARR